MRSVIPAMALAAGLMVLNVNAGDLGPAKNEPNLEKRSRLALSNADQALNEARDAYEKPDMKLVQARLAEVLESVELAQKALTATGKKPGRTPGPYKYAETRTRELLRRLEGFKDVMDSSDRAVIEPVQNRVQEIHDAWLDGILTHAK